MFGLGCGVWKVGEVSGGGHGRNNVVGLGLWYKLFEKDDDLHRME